jgi:hypothetical protein
MKPSENEKQSGNEDKEYVTISPLLIQRSHLTLRVKPFWITLLYMCAQVCGIHVSMLISIHERIQGEAAMVVSPFTARSSSHMGLHLGVTVDEVATFTFSPTNILRHSHPSDRECGAMPADREWERGNMDVPVHQPSYEYH